MRFQESEAALDDRDKVVTDIITGLMWQQEVSDRELSYKTAEEYIHKFNQDSFAGHKDWRLPTIPEFMSLLLPDFYCANGGEFIDSVFKKGRWPGYSFWSADRCEPDSAWHVNFAILDVGPLNVSYELCVRAVRYI